jgi:hypothetical protein
MEKYVSEYLNYNKKIAFYFKTSDNNCGGIGDYIKYLSFLIKIGIKYNIAVYCINFGNESDQFLKLIYNTMFIKFEDISNNMIVIDPEYKFKTEEEFNEIQPVVFNVINPKSLFSFDNKPCDINYSFFHNNTKLYDIFYFDNDVINNIPTYLKNTKYISIHIRIGCFTNLDNPNVSSFNEDNLDRFICKKKDSTLIYLCTDSIVLKKKLKDKYKHILITDFDIAHTGDIHATKKSILNTITELLILANSEAIFTADTVRVSGFPLAASRFKNINFMKLPIN